MYTPEAPPQNFEDVWRELLNIQSAMIENQVDYVQFKVWHTEPDKPRQGQLYYADGTNWNPGSGEGLYRYSGGWVLV